MAFTGHLEQANQFALEGWVHSHTFSTLVPFVDIVINRRHRASVRAGNFREDLQQQQGLGNGHRGFSFNPFECLSPGTNVVEVFVSGSDQLLENGRRTIDYLEQSKGELRPRPAADQKLSSLPAFLQEQVSRFLQANASLAILELPPEASSHIAAPQRRVNLIVSAALCEQLYPSIASSLYQIYEALHPGGIALLTFASEDPDLSASRAYFESDMKTFHRVYSETELRMFFVEAGFEILDVTRPALPNRATVIARKPAEIA